MSVIVSKEVNKRTEDSLMIPPPLCRLLDVFYTSLYFKKTNPFFWCEELDRCSGAIDVFSKENAFYSTTFTGNVYLRLILKMFDFDVHCADDAQRCVETKSSRMSGLRKGTRQL